MSQELEPLVWSTVQRRVRDLVPLEYNPRILTEEGRARLERSMLKFNLVEIPAINLDDVVLAGHQRLRILLDMGRGDEVIDVRAPNRLLTKDELDEYNITSNVGAGIWDYQSLHENFAHIDLGGLMDTSSLDVLAKFSASIELPAEEQEFDPAPPAIPVTVEGDLYEFESDGRGLTHRLLCASSTDSDAVARVLDEQLVDLVLTDPPYNVDYQGKTKDALKIQNDKMHSGAFYLFLYDFYLNCFTFMKPGAPIYVFHADSEGANFRVALRDAGLKLSQCLMWVKQAFVMGRQDFHWQHEPILYGWKEGAAHPWYSDRKQTTVLHFDRPSRNADHPTMKPLDILEYLLQCSSKVGDVVYDGFGGSGSLLVTCEKNDRNARVQELDPAYCDVHVRRYVKFMRDNQRRFTVSRNGVELTQQELARYES